MTRLAKKKALVAAEKAMTPQDVADVLGCQPEEAHLRVAKYWLMNGRKKFRPADVYAVRDREVRRATEMRRQNNRMVREAGR